MAENDDVINDLILTACIKITSSSVEVSRLLTKICYEEELAVLISDTSLILKT